MLQIRTWRVGKLVLVYRGKLPVPPQRLVMTGGSFGRALMFSQPGLAEDFAIQETEAGDRMEGVKWPDWNCHQG